MSSVLPHLTSVRDDEKLVSVPPPICVQVQVSSRCSTDCRMCDHFRLGDKNGELTLKEWSATFHELSSLGVRTVIFSGGEPLVRDDIAELLRAAQKSRLQIGLLTSGQMTKKIEEFKEAAAAILETVDWIAVSIDGTEAFERKIRVPHNVSSKDDGSRRSALLQELCAALKTPESTPKLSATVTLQHDNICMDLEEVCRFIHGLGIPQVNFKLVTGDIRTLHKPPNYLLRLDELKNFVHFLNNDALCLQKGNNLAYLRRTFNTKVFSLEDVEKGAPLTQFYAGKKLRCYTPMLFSLIDYNGDVSLCCHLYRDNHGFNRKSKSYRKTHRLGNVKETEFNFKAIWNGERYARDCRSLTVIDPNQEDFYPCGECTRHCQHNIILNRVQELYREDSVALKHALDELGTTDIPVWF